MKTMFKKAGIAVVAAVGAVSVGMLLLGTAFAFGPGPKSDTAVGGRDIPLTVASDLTGLSEDELQAELAGGTTIPALLEEKGIDLDTFHQAVADARQAALDAAVAAGTISPERAQVMAQNMEQAQVSAGQNGPQYRAGERAGDCTGDGNQYKYGQSDASGQGNSWGVPGDATGPGLEHQYGKSTS
jgi:hypothetical protein